MKTTNKGSKQHLNNDQQSTTQMQHRQKRYKQVQQQVQNIIAKHAKEIRASTKTSTANRAK